jgi:ketosteroid isomerase-like protein
VVPRRYPRRVYRALINRRIRSGFASLSDGDPSTLVTQLADNVHHVFAGEHPLGGERHTRESVTRWFDRLFRLFPQLRLDVRRVVSSGPPWDVLACVEWVAHVTPAAGESYVNQGAHVIRIRSGRVVYLHAYEDSQKVAQACTRMAELGIREASAAPIVD